MLESSTRVDSRGRDRTELKNVVDVNFSANNLGFLSAWFARRTRLVHVRELGSNHATVRIVLPVSVPTRVLVPGCKSFISWAAKERGAVFESTLGDCLRTRMLVVHEAHSAELLARIAQSYLPDVVCMGGAVPVADQWLHRPDILQLTDLVTKAELREWGVAELTFWSTQQGRTTLGHALGLFDGFIRRRKQELVRVYDVRDLVLCDGFYPVESEGHNNWAWTGDGTVGTFLIPSHGNGRARITLFFFGATIPLDGDNIEVLVDDQRSSCKFFGNEKIEITTSALSGGCAHRLDIVQSRTMPTADGSRQIGCALHKVKMEML